MSSPSDADREPIRGRYPGGPSREGDGSTGGAVRRSPELSRAEELETRAHRGRQHRVRKRRRRRVAVGFVVALLVAGAVGFWMGISSHRTAAEIAREEEAAAREREFDPAAESDRLLQQLWLMEDLERARQP